MLLVICAGNSPVTGEFPAQRPVTRSYDVNNREAGNLRRNRAHYDVIVERWSFYRGSIVFSGTDHFEIWSYYRGSIVFNGTDHLGMWSYYRGSIVFNGADHLERWSFHRGSILFIFSCFLQNQDKRSTACSGYEPTSPRTAGPSGPAGHDLAASDRGHPSAFVAGTWNGKFPARLCRWYGSHPTGYWHLLFHLSNRRFYRTNPIHPLLGPWHMGWNIREY